MKRVFAAARDAVGEEPIAAGGVQALRNRLKPETPNETRPNRKLKSIFATAHDAIG